MKQEIGVFCRQSPDSAGEPSRSAPRRLQSVRTSAVPESQAGEAPRPPVARERAIAWATHDPGRKGAAPARTGARDARRREKDSGPAATRCSGCDGATAGGAGCPSGRRPWASWRPGATPAAAVRGGWPSSPGSRTDRVVSTRGASPSAAGRGACGRAIRAGADGWPPLRGGCRSDRHEDVRPRTIPPVSSAASAAAARYAPLRACEPTVGVASSVAATGGGRSAPPAAVDPQASGVVAPRGCTVAVDGGGGRAVLAGAGPSLASNQARLPSGASG